MNRRFPKNKLKSHGRPSEKQESQKTHIPKDVRMVPGFHAVNEAIRVRPESIVTLWVRKDGEGIDEIIQIKNRAEKIQIQIQLKSMQEMTKYATGHQGVIALLSEDPALDWEELKTESQIMLLALDGLEDPHNLGAIMRTAWLMQAKALFVPEARSVHLTPAAIKVASGGAEHIPIQVESNLPSLLKSLKDIGFWIYGLSHKTNQVIWDLELPEKVVWVIGSEGKGLRTPVERACDELVSIPQASSLASYNASVAAAIAMTETQRQWRTL
ncbi:MAG: 23S rRNA (guanosine(2251)-2'-O)-methyltransferase RlmB [Bdellovibrionales bacterium]|nr:23S rRNA (guanosine(2251)-2'-O)-methyltransferase RlmB [Bdellovibrionales bacterium]